MQETPPNSATDPPPARRLALVTSLLFTLLLLIEPSTRFYAALLRHEIAEFGALFTPAPSVEALRLLEDKLEQGSPLAQSLQPPLRTARFLLLGDGGEKLLLGHDDWLFYRPAVEFLNAPLPDAKLQEAVEAVVDFQQQLQERNIKLIFLLAPDKASIGALYINGTFQELRPGHGPRFLRALEERGVEVENLFGSTFDYVAARTYLSFDTHWRPEEAERAGHGAAQRVKSLLPDLKPQLVYSLKQQEVRRAGDLLRMLNIPDAARYFPPEFVTCVQVIDPEGKPFAPSPQAPVLVMGDSFLRIYEQDEPGAAGFVAHLAASLGQRVSAIISDGGAANRVREQLAQRPGLLEHAQIVIWEVAERELGLAEGGWQKISLGATNAPRHEPGTSAEEREKLP